MGDYKSKAKTISITATSRASVKVKESYYTIEYSEERSIPDDDSVILTEERKLLWERVNSEVDSQIEDIIRTFK